MTPITDHQKALLEGILGSDYRDGASDAEMRAGHAVWTFSACEKIPEASRGGVIAKAVEAGLVGHQDDGDDSVIWLTEQGFDAVRRR